MVPPICSFFALAQNKKPIPHFRIGSDASANTDTSRAYKIPPILRSLPHHSSARKNLFAPCSNNLEWHGLQSTRTLSLAIGPANCRKAQWKNTERYTHA